MKARDIVLVVVACALMCSVIVLLAVGISTHHEPGLMAQTPGFGAHDTPISICVRAYADGTDPADSVAHAEQAVANAEQTINGRLGFAAFTILGPADPGPCAITVTVGTPAEAGWRDPGGDATFTNGSRQCSITTTNVPTETLLDLVLQHELGHCLGLDHDCFHASIMCGGDCCTLAEPAAGEYPPRIDDSDRATLRALFGR